MASHVIPANTTLSQITPQTAGQKPATPVIAGWFSRRGVPLRRRRKVPTVRLGGKKTRRGYFLVRLLRRVRVRWLRLKNSCMLKKLKDYYHSLVQDLIDGGGTMESFQQRLFLETSFGVPVMGLTFNTFPNAGSSLHARLPSQCMLRSAPQCFTASAFIKAPSSLKSISKVFGLTYCHCGSYELNLTLPYSCRAGACSSTFAGKMVKGAVDQSDGSFPDENDQMKEGYLLTCISYPTADFELHTHKEGDLY
ncbi:hypothetical protein RJ639_016889 [Escallonia herrerae]|uniref:Ferredoxin n=1 Tax=Escallonia herrerae TaxID=1293975 RepID=A0AA88VEW6_9ASTE|nr:hypothetical protein RJ639_016889 [Escallonia herrerae]